MMIGLIQNDERLESDIRDLIYAFFFGVKIKKVTDTSDQYDLYVDVKVTGEQVAFSLVKEDMIVGQTFCESLDRNPVKESIN